MARILPRRWLHPQAVPRGFLRLYILTLLSRGPETGYSIMQRIDETTEGAWKPGAGTMYPLLRGLVTDGLAKPDKKGSGSKAYAITVKGRKELGEMRDRLAGAGRKERVLGRLFSDILPPSVIVPSMVSRYKDGFELFRKSVAQLPLSERSAHLRDLRLFMESQIQWIDSQLEGAVQAAPRPAARNRY
ncbi:MAG: PadR family transcriptional regulator [Nitrososphaerota archaeon]|nr:PadR family transcriptional regulator [Nitrososphaerota archaeon]